MHEACFPNAVFFIISFLYLFDPNLILVIHYCIVLVTLTYLGYYSFYYHLLFNKSVIVVSEIKDTHSLLHGDLITISYKSPLVKIISVSHM